MNRKRRVLFLMDAYETLNFETETSLLLMQELLARGHAVFWLEQKELSLQHQIPRGRVHPVKSITPFLREPAEEQELNDFDLLLVRKDPPFDAGYLHLTLILDHLAPSVIQFNSINALRNYNEKLLPLRWPELTPPTLVTQDPEQLVDFAESHGEVVLKPLDDCSGRGIQLLRATPDGAHNRAAVDYLQRQGASPGFVLAQKFLPGVGAGDKRVYVVDGEVVGLVNRIPAPGGFLANIHQGARCEATTLDEREQMIIETIRPFLQREGIFLAGVDLIDGYLTELNITSPSAVRQINEVSGLEIHKRIVDRMLHHADRKQRCCDPRATLKWACC